MQQKFELLAPAGDLERVRTALRFGADAVYLGGPQMQLRAGQVGFTMEKLAQAVREAHAIRKKVYVTVNAFAYNRDIEALPEYAQALHAVGVDAVIVSDLGAISVIRKAVSDLPVHVSTQANCLNYAAAQVYASGYRRTARKGAARTGTGSLRARRDVHELFRALYAFCVFDVPQRQSRRVRAILSMDVSSDGGKASGAVLSD